MSSRLTTFCLLAANVLIPIAVLTFASGFFPYKPFLPGLAQYETLDYGPPPQAPFDKVIFMVVDALRRYLGWPGGGGPFQLTCAATLCMLTAQASSLSKGMSLDVSFNAVRITANKAALYPLVMPSRLPPMQPLLPLLCRE